MSKSYGQFFLFGDSITQMSFDQEHGFGFGASLQNSYVRRLDVINRGLGGYNTRKALKVLPELLPAVSKAEVRFLVIFFGANDACLPFAGGHHVPLVDYRHNIQKIIEHPSVKSQSPRIILVTPPPVNEHQHLEDDRQKGFDRLRRTAKNTKLYADACKDVGKSLGIPVADIWTAFLREGGWIEGEALVGSLERPESEKFNALFSDGVHLLLGGQRIIFDEIMKVIRGSFPDQTPENLSPIFPTWEFAPE